MIDEPRELTGVPNSVSRAEKLALVLGSLWLVAMTLGYVWTVGSSLARPFARIPYHTDARWMMVFVGAGIAGLVFAGLVALQFVYRRVPFAIAGMLLLAVLGLVMIVARHQLIAALVASWIVLLGYLYGDWLLRRAGMRGSAQPGERLTAALASGLALLTPAILMLTVVGWLSSRTVLGALIFLTALQWKSLLTLLRRFRDACTNWRLLFRVDVSSPDRNLIRLLLAMVAFNNLLWALVPEHTFDALNYQLAVPRMYLEYGGLVDLPYFWHSYFARLVGMLFLATMALGGPISAKLLIFAIGMITAGSVYVLARGLLSERAGLWAVAIFYSTPLVSWLSTVAYIDLAVAMFVTTAWLSFFRWLRGGGTGWLITTGVLIGGVVGAKPNGAYALPVMAGMFVWLIFTRRRSLINTRDLAAFTAAIALIGLPWFLLTWKLTGNPVFPFFNGIFKSELWQPVNNFMNSGDYGVGRSPLALFLMPFEFTFNTNLFDELLPSGGVGIALLLLPLAIFGTLGARKRSRILLIATALYLVFWALTIQYARYYIPILPIIVALSVAGVIGWAATGWARKVGTTVLWVILLSQGLLIPAAFGDVVRRNPLMLVSGRLTDPEFLRRALRPYRGAEYLNTVTKPGDWVIGAGVDYIRYYLHAPLIAMGETYDLPQQIDDATPEEVAQRLYARGVRYLFLNRAEPAGQRGFPFLKRTFLARFAVLQFRYDFVEIYSLSPAEVPVTQFQGTNVLANPGFEALDAQQRLEAWVATGAIDIGGDLPKPFGGQNRVSLNGAAEVRQRIAVASNRLYTFGVYSRGERASDLITLQIEWFDIKGRVLDKTVEQMVAGMDWQWSSIPITVPQGAVSAELVVAGSAGTSISIDEAWFGLGDHPLRRASLRQLEQRQ